MLFTLSYCLGDYYVYTSYDMQIWVDCGCDVEKVIKCVGVNNNENIQLKNEVF